MSAWELSGKVIFGKRCNKLELIYLWRIWNVNKTHVETFATLSSLFVHFQQASKQNLLLSPAKLWHASDKPRLTDKHVFQNPPKLIATTNPTINVQLQWVGYTADRTYSWNSSTRTTFGNPIDFPLISIPKKKKCISDEGNISTSPHLTWTVSTRSPILSTGAFRPIATLVA